MGQGGTQAAHTTRGLRISHPPDDLVDPKAKQAFGKSLEKQQIYTLLCCACCTTQHTTAAHEKPTPTGHENGMYSKRIATYTNQSKYRAGEGAEALFARTKYESYGPTDQLFQETKRVE